MKYRSHHCGALRLEDQDKEVQLSGWVQAIRHFGSLVFIDLRDRYGITQLVVDKERKSQVDLSDLGREYVIEAKGKVRERSNKNPELPTGEIEIEVASLRVLNPSLNPPFTIEDDTDGGEELRMKYRYLDLRRPVLQRNLKLRYELTRVLRQ